MEVRKGCKIRKRGCSSSSSSSLARRNRFKRAILAGKRAVRGTGGGLGTPIKPNAALTGKSPAFPFSPEKFLTEAQNSSVSARKLAATLWEIGSSISPPGSSDGENREKTVKLPQDFPPKLSDPIFRLGSNKYFHKMERSAGDSVRRTPTVSQNLPLIDYKRGSSNLTETRDNGKRSDHLNDVSDRIMTSKELVKILTRVNKLGDHHYHNNQTASKRLILALRSELDRARSTLKCLIREQSDGDVARLMECFAEEKRRWRRRMEREVAAERKLRQQTERMNKKLSRELADAKAETRRLTEELQRESRAKEILEQVCDELVRGVGEDKVEAERIMKEAERVKAEVEKEREMMHIADVLREERVQMKLTDAKFEFEEKNAVVERLRNELRRVLTEEQEEEDGKGYSPSLRHIKRVLDIIDGCGAGGGAEGGEGSDQESDLKSIELNMDSFNKSYKWSYVESGQFSDKDHRRKSGFPISGDGDSEDSVDKTSVIVDFQTRDGEEIDRDKSIKSLRDYIMSNVRIVGSSEQWNRIVGTPE